MSSVTTRPAIRTVGNTARKLATPAPQPTPRKRTPLVVVPSAPRRKSVVFVASCFAVLAAALVGVLLLNIQLSQGQYDMVALKAKQSALTKKNQELSQEVQNFNAPQNLAAKATAMGMVPSAGQGQIDLDRTTVSGKAVAATKDEKTKSAIIAAPAIAGQLSVVPSSTEDQATTDSTQKKPAESKTTAQAPAVPQVPKVQLNGGTVPAPAQRTPGN